jgi:hypothetical protein
MLFLDFLGKKRYRNVSSMKKNRLRFALKLELINVSSTNSRLRGLKARQLMRVLKKSLIFVSHSGNNVFF